MEENKAKELNKAFFEMNDILMEEIDLSKFKGPKGLFAKTISMKEFQKISESCTTLKKGVDPEKAKSSDYEFNDDFVAVLIAASVCDCDGNLIFGYDEVPAILKKSKMVFETISISVMKMNKVATEEEVQEKEKK